MSKQANPSTSEATRKFGQLTAEETHSNAIDILLDGSEIGTLINEEGNVTDEMRELAALFVAAPDMLSALKDLRELAQQAMKFIPTEPQDNPARNIWHDLDIAIKSANRAIAKAEQAQ